ncbi:hypothetical protein MW290_14375 [Aquincola tertiaricarbonis]|uniref:Uncharacterized protein n=1 Tax=Aquincola tertiaricarbonis TaxID=391953 RepID=A0ABY4SFX2_AQUTE|nr:hypothetical protein [Aquincola tertiaricarbonis]URI10205.1 hypothetical protein MW290_14375 [Aquincola tertiaricarbonis]
MRDLFSPVKPPVAVPPLSREERVQELLRLEQRTPWTTRRVRSALLPPPAAVARTPLSTTPT